MDLAFALAFAIGVVAGLRSMTAPATVSWGAHLKWLDLRNSYLAFVGSAIAVAIISLLALAELIADKLPKTPNRTAAVGLTARILTGAFSGATICIAANQSAVMGALLGGLGGIAGAFGGFHVRRYLVQDLHAPDIVIAVGEDLVAICGGLLIASKV